MHICIMIIEDKLEEQEKALAAILKLLELVIDPMVDLLNPLGLSELTGTRLIPCAKQGEQRSVLVFMASTHEAFSTYAPPLFFKGMKFEKTLILTDLMFPKRKGEKENMWGIEVIINAIEKNMNVVICSDTDHHDIPFMPSLIKTLEKSHVKGKIPVVLDNKDWEKAVALGLELLKT